MAKAEKVPPTIHVPVWEPYVTLTLSKEEAQALYDVTRSIGGNLKTTRRRYFEGEPESINGALTPYATRKEVTDGTGSIWFT